MTDQDQINEYVHQIDWRGGRLPSNYHEDPTAMQIAKLQDVWRKLQ